MGAGGDNRVLYLVDGTSNLFRAYFAIRGLTNAQGVPTNAVYGFTSMLRKLMQEEKPAYLGVAFDLPGPTFRHDRYAEYKANRPEAPEDLNVQVPYAKQVCEALKIPVLEKEGFEADDLIATFVREARKAGFSVVVVASDKDLLQLVGDGVIVLNPTRDERLNAQGVEESFGVPPERVRDVLGLMGDAVDNIPGVPGVGEKTAKAMVSTYGDVEQVIERAKRFAEAFDARDAVLDAIVRDAEAGEVRAALSRLEKALIALDEVEKDNTLRPRWREAREAVRAALADLEKEGSNGPDLRALKRVLKSLDKGSGKRLWYAVRDHAEQARLSRELATVDRNVPFRFDPEALRVSEPDREKAARLFRFLGFRRLTEEFGGEPPEERKEDEAPPAGRPVFRVLLDRAALENEVAACRKVGRFAVDTETDGVDPMRARLVGISLAHDESGGAYIPVGHDYVGAPDQLPLETVRELLGPLLVDAAVPKIGQNIKYDLHVLRRHGLPVEGLGLDTMVGAFLLNPDRNTFGMDSLAEEYLSYTPIHYVEIAGKGSSQRTLNLVDVERVAEYAAEDAVVTLRLARVIGERLRATGLDRLYETLDGPLLPILARMEQWGIRVDLEILHRMSEELAAAQEKLRAEIHDLAGTVFNVDSPKQLREVLFERLGLKSGRRTAKTGAASTDARTLEDLADKHPIARKLLEYRELAKLKGTYVDTLPALVHPETGRVHTSYHPTGAATGRLSSSDPNLQNIPVRTEIGRRIRSAFVADPGHVFLASDYSQVELRVLAHLSGDPELVSAFRRGEDIHRHTASRIFGVAPDLVSSEMRRRAKAVNFGVLYGMSETRLAREQQIPRAEARRFIQAYFQRFQGVRDYITRVRKEAERDAAVRTLFGRVRYFPVLHRRAGRGAREQALRAAVNTTIQGTAADLMKMAMIRVDRALREIGSQARMLLQVHDELLLEVPENELERVRERVRREMEEVHPLDVPLLVDQSTGANWMDVG